jgi:hypothetical protein
MSGAQLQFDLVFSSRKKLPTEGDQSNAAFERVGRNNESIGSSSLNADPKVHAIHDTYLSTYV